ncbi:MAG: hypothetical protein GXP05_13625 [Alphaproteobacteria bacterium]|nr:hypothetical protein [Alphaproteobacteria bacterium]
MIHFMRNVLSYTAIHQVRTKPPMDDFGLWLKSQLARVSEKFRLGEKLRYIHSYWDGRLPASRQVYPTSHRV